MRLRARVHVGSYIHMDVCDDVHVTMSGRGYNGDVNTPTQ